ncbi:MAG: hypothetical protein J7M12_03895, partial [Candidatus Hydrogenedentes bacterium]|nr:hypothetical protein [Candidatus Hydrogenedentota bacterium]
MMKRAIIARVIAAVAAGLICVDTALGTGTATTFRQILYAVFACSALSAIIMLVRLRQDFEVPRRPVRIQVVFDVLIVTALVYFSGGVSSMLPLLY